MLTNIPDDVKQEIKEAVATGDFRPIELGGPHTPREWLAMIEYQASKHKGAAAARLVDLAQQIRKEGYQPIRLLKAASPVVQPAARRR